MGILCVCSSLFRFSSFALGGCFDSTAVAAVAVLVAVVEARYARYFFPCESVLYARTTVSVVVQMAVETVKGIDNGLYCGEDSRAGQTTATWIQQKSPVNSLVESTAW